MKANIRSLSALAVFAAAALSVHAQVGSGDVVVGFRSGGALNDFEINAGLVSSLASDTTETQIANVVSDLSGLSSTWASSASGNAAVLWGVTGYQSGSQVYASSIWDNTTPGTLGTANSANAWNSLTSGNISQSVTKIQQMISGYNGINATATASGGINIAKSQSLSWTTQGGTGAAAFGTFNPNNNGFTQLIGNGIELTPDGSANANFTAEDLYSVVAGNSTFLGTFALYTAADSTHAVGELTFTAIPEPSTYAMILGVAALGFVMLRRRQQVLA
jgi:hypothetical protein